MRQSPTYRFSSAPGWVAVVIHALGFVVVVPILTSQPPIWAFAFVFVVWGFICWTNLFLAASELRMEDGVVRWRAPLRSGELPVQSIRSVRNVFPSWWPLVRIGGPGGPSVFTYGTSDLRAFVLALLSERPGIDVDQRSYRSWHDPWRFRM
jgi:hypothetical protein